MKNTIDENLISKTPSEKIFVDLNIKDPQRKNLRRLCFAGVFVIKDCLKRKTNSFRAIYPTLPANG